MIAAARRTVRSKTQRGCGAVSIAHLGSGGLATPGAAPGAERTPPHDLLAEQSALGGMLLSQGRRRRRRRDRCAAPTSTSRSTSSSSTPSCRCTRTASRPTSSPSPTSSSRRGELARAGGADYLHTLTCHRADRGERRLLRVDRRRARAAAPPGRGRHPHRADGLRRRGRGRSTSSTTPRPRSTASPAATRPRTTSRSTDAVTTAIDEIEAASRPRRLDDRCPHRLRRPRRAHQRSAPRADDHRRRATGPR